ncbi:MAG: hypothetical protein OXC41_06920 [Gammaproteobacteria bacterium]|nr:hypothetical protein [Gammaproteobacteria bacterium]
MINSQQQFTHALEVIELNANKLFLILNYLDDIKHDLGSDYVSGSDYELESKLQALYPMLDMMNLESAKSQVERIIDSFKMPVTGYEVAQSLKELRNRVVDDFKHPALYCFNAVEKNLIEQGEEVFAQKVRDIFTDTKYDLEEAVQCLGFSRYTACVFHLMRAMEQAVRRIGDELEFTVQDEDGHYLTWGKMIGNMEARLKDIKKTDMETHDKWQDLVPLLYCVKKAWRNTTMHPDKVYSKVKAEKVFTAVKDLMETLADTL